MKKAFRSISILTLVFGMLLYSSMFSTVAAASLTLNPSSGRPGSSVTVVGSGFGASETGISVTYDGNVITSGISADSGGNWTGTFVVPASAGGSHLVGAFGSVTTGSSVPTRTFVITAVLTISRNSGPPGTTVQVTGSGYSSNEGNITVTFDGTQVGAATTASSTGNWTSSITIPASGAGAHAIGAVGSSTNGVPTQTFTLSTGVSLSRTSGPPGTSVQINGSGFAPNETGISVTFDGNPIGASLTADTTGAWTTSFTVPASPSGSHSISATGSVTTGSNVPSVSFSISSGIAVNKASAPPGSSIQVTGSGFASGETGITLTFDGTQVGSTVTANATGGWTASFAVPASSSGSHTIGAYGSTTSASTISGITFTISSGITVNRINGAPGTVVTVAGSGFAANETGITVTYDGTPVGQAPAANASGAWTSTFAVPASSAGVHAIGAYGSSTQASQVSPASFNILAGIVVNKTSGSSGTSVSVTGYGFGAGETGIQVLYDNAIVAQGISANAAGGWTATFTAPPSSAGVHVISAKGSITQQVGGGSDTGFKTSSAISISPELGFVGATITISGSGFAGGGTLQITFDDNVINATRGTTADASGSFKISVAVPKAKAGDHGIQVTDSQNNAASVNFVIDNTPPPVPRPLTPEDGSRIGIVGGTTPTLTWSAVTSPNGGVTYTVQIDTNSDFSAPILEKSNITGVHYTLAQAEALPQGEFFWRVRAVDGASNQGAWSEPISLKSGLMSTGLFILLIVVALAIIGIAAYLVITRVVRRRQKAAIPIPVPEQLPEIITPEIIRPEITTGQWRAIGSGTGTAADGSARKALPFRLALPQAEKKADRGLSSEDQARIKVMIDFAQSMPLIEPGYDLAWLAGLAESNTGAEASPALYEQLVRGEIQLRYEPAWMRHPTFQDLTTLLEGQPVLQDLNSFLDAVNRCAQVTTQLLGDIFKDMGPDVPEDFFNKGGWGYVSAVYTDAVSWFLGKYLREPSDKDYSIKSDGNVSGDATTFALSGESNTPFAGTLVQGVSEEDAQKFKALHLKLRRSYRNSDKAKNVVSLISQLDVQRGRLLQAFSQVSQIGQ